MLRTAPEEGFFLDFSDFSQFLCGLYHKALHDNIRRHFLQHYPVHVIAAVYVQRQLLSRGNALQPVPQSGRLDSEEGEAPGIDVHQYLPFLVPVDISLPVLLQSISRVQYILPALSVPDSPATQSEALAHRR
jgi:hypothetical protein